MRTAVIGLGWWGRTLVEAADRADARLTVTHAVTLEPAEAADFAERHRLRVLDRYEAVLADPEVEAVVLATPHSLHVEQVEAAAASGKHVYTEKPLALSSAAADRAIAACRRAGVVLAVGHDKRFLPAVMALSELVRGGGLGEVLHVEAQYSNDNSSRAMSGAWRDSPGEAPGGGLSGPGLHALDAVVALAGPVRRTTAQIHAVAAPPRPVDTVSALLDFVSGASGVLTSVRAIPDYFRLQVAGTRGWAEVRDFSTLVHRPLDADLIVRSFDDSTLAAAYLLDRFADAVRGREEFPVSVESVRNTVAAFEAVVAALTAPGWVWADPARKGRVA